VVLLPCVTVRALGDTLIVKSGAGAAVTLNPTVVERWSAPLVPVIVSVDVPGGVAPVVATVSVALPDPAIDAGENDGVAPEGAPDAPRFTVPVNPLSAPTVTV
jgi:hypothetical protein